MKYQSQRVAYWYILAALALFGVQVLGGLLAGWIYVSPNFLSDILPFNVIRMIHTNALIVWLLLGFFGAAYFLIPEESEREIWSPKLAYVQLIILLVGTLGAVGSYLVGIHGGREFLEQPLWVKFGIHPQQYSNEVEVYCNAPVLDKRWVRDSGGHLTERIVIATDFALGEYRWPIELTLTARDDMMFRMLLGRTAMRGRFAVDPARSYMLKPRRKQTKQARPE